MWFSSGNPWVTFNEHSATEKPGSGHVFLSQQSLLPHLASLVAFKAWLTWLCDWFLLLSPLSFLSTRSAKRKKKYPPFLRSWKEAESGLVLAGVIFTLSSCLSFVNTSRIHFRIQCSYSALPLPLRLYRNWGTGGKGRGMKGDYISFSSCRV